MKEMQAPCGLDCSTCNLYNAGHDEAAAAALVSWFRARSWIGETEGVEAVRRKAPLCSGGRDWARQPFCGDCYMRGCCEENQLMDCSACPYFPCVHYLNWTLDTPHHQEAMATLIDRQKELPF